MYEDVSKFQNLRNLRKERFLRMQTLTRPDYSPARSNPGDSQALKVAMMAVMLFALSGLITGFAFGAFVHFSPAKSPNSTNGITTTQQNTGSTTNATPQKAKPVPLGLPLLKGYSYSEIANGTTYYSASVQVTDAKTPKGVYTWGNPLSASGITCKLWLVQRIPPKKILNIPSSTRGNIQSLQNPITGQVGDRSFAEITGLSFDPSTPQTQNCNASGQATWKYQVSQSVTAGNYDLVVLTDWAGKISNWSWYNITINQAD